MSTEARHLEDILGYSVFAVTILVRKPLYI